MMTEGGRFREAVRDQTILPVGVGPMRNADIGCVSPHGAFAATCSHGRTPKGASPSFETTGAIAVFAMTAGSAAINNHRHLRAALRCLWRCASAPPRPTGPPDCAR